MPDDGGVSSKLAGAHKALDKAKAFTGSVVKQSGGTSNAFEPKKESPKSDYSHVREARKSQSDSGSGEFMGIRSNQSTDLNTALAAREDARKALGPQ